MDHETMQTRRTATLALLRKMDKKAIDDITAGTEASMRHFIRREGVSPILTSKERMRLFSAGVRNNGFIDQAFAVARNNSGFLPPFFGMADFARNYVRFVALRQLMLMLQQFLQIVTNAFMVQSDVCYQDGLRIYDSVQGYAAVGAPGAKHLFDTLRPFFARRGTAAEPMTATTSAVGETAGTRAEDIGTTTAAASATVKTVETKAAAGTKARAETKTSAAGTKTSAAAIHEWSFTERVHGKLAAEEEVA